MAMGIVIDIQYYHCSVIQPLFNSVDLPSGVEHSVLQAGRLPSCCLAEAQFRSRVLALKYKPLRPLYDTYKRHKTHVLSLGMKSVIMKYMIYLLDQSCVRPPLNFV
jgi:hypothetical protein